MSIVRRTRWIAGGLVLAATTVVPALAQDSVEARSCCNSTCRSTPREQCGSRRASDSKRRHQEAWWGYPEEFCAQPLGDCVRAHIATQVGNGEAARMVLYHYDFVDGSDKLSVRGTDQLAKIAALLPTNSYKVVIERITDDPDLAERRRHTVIVELGRGSFPVPNERVQVGSPIARGMNGADAVSVSNNLSRQTQSRGSQVGGASGYGSVTGSGTSEMGRTTAGR